jgi:peroxiredoxin Q/BCP
MPNLTTGKPAPEFNAPSTLGQDIALEDYRGKNVVLYFYPKDLTPGWTKEAQDFRDNLQGFEDTNAVVLGVSTDDLKMHEKFIEKIGINFPLISDTEADLCKKYDVWKLKKNFGKEYMGIERSTFVIDKEGNLAQEWRKVKVDGHVDEVLGFVRTLPGLS